LYFFWLCRAIPVLHKKIPPGKYSSGIGVSDHIFIESRRAACERKEKGYVIFGYF